MKHYVLGFATDGSTIAFITKIKPKWQAGLKNGIGGKIEEGETPIQAMVREFEEETSVKTDESNWKQYAILYNDDFKMHVFVGGLLSVQMEEVKTNTDEEVTKHTYDYVIENNLEFIDNIPWILSMFFDKAVSRGIFEVKYPNF